MYDSLTHCVCARFSKLGACSRSNYYLSMAFDSVIKSSYHDLQLCTQSRPRALSLGHINRALSPIEPSFPVAFLPRVTPQSVVNCANFARHTLRAVSFWRRVITIWASFKLTQATVAIQTPFRKPEWPARAWSSQHHRAADVCLLSPIPIDFALTLVSAEL